MTVLAHLSDLHATPVRAGWRDLGAFLNKRGVGWLSWRMKRRHEYRPEVLAALVADLAEQEADHIAVTGDLTNLGLEDEFVAAAAWLRELGDPQRISLVPGNHDAYVHIPRARSWDHWREFMASDPERVNGVPTPGPADGFPSLRIRGPLALVGLCSAHPTPLHRASGTLGARQVDAAEAILKALAGRPLCRVVLIHHPPLALELARRRQLTDAARIQEMFERVGADLVIHGHSHRTSVARLKGPTRAIPVVGVRSGSALGRKPGRRAQYHLYRIRPSEGGAEGATAFRIEMIVRGYDPELRGFKLESESTLSE